MSVGQSDRSRPRLLDLFCGAGGAAVGYHRAGFEVVGVDNRPQPRYPFEFHQADATTFDLEGFDAIHASPPCQGYSRATRHLSGSYPLLIESVRRRLEATGAPFVIENVAGAPLRDPLILCGTGFGLGAEGFEHRRHRLFECSFPAMATPCWHRLPCAPLFGHNAGRDFMRLHGRGFGIEAKREAFGIDWMNREELAEAIPPAFTEHIGGYLIAEVRARQEAAA